MGELAVITENILQALAAGLLIGCIYGLMCAGLGVIFGVMRVINFAQGDFMMLGMYSAYYLATSFGLLAVLGPPILFIIGIFVHRYLVTRVTGVQVAGLEGEGHFAQLILTLGVALVISNGALIFFGSEPLSIRTPLSRTAWEVGPIFGDSVSIFVNKARFVGAAVSVLVAFGLYVFVTKFRFGKALRAAADNPQSATYVGVDVDHAHRIAFGLGVAITGVAGGLVASYYPFQPYVGIEFVIVMYAGVVLGGMGSIIGAFWGGLIIGLVQQMSTLILPTQLQNTAIFIVFLLVIFLKPQGLFGRNAERT
ncbi:MAG: branched-chain amino acid ABC transporter permease [Hyphomicrobiales bacterium]|nr:branched-chain amino acid ABC transporter permease [Hyphomicrobiales bacterium]